MSHPDATPVSRLPLGARFTWAEHLEEGDDLPRVVIEPGFPDREDSQCVYVSLERDVRAHAEGRLFLCPRMGVRGDYLVVPLAEAGRRVCAWCKTDMGPRWCGTAGTTHGACEPCRKGLQADIDKAHACQATLTGRMASSEPALQNIPIRTPEGRRLRDAFNNPPQQGDAR